MKLLDFNEKLLHYKSEKKLCIIIIIIFILVVVEMNYSTAFFNH